MMNSANSYPETAAFGWDDFLTERDKAYLQATEWTKTSATGLGNRPAVLVVDDYYQVLGTRREPVLESIKTWPKSCGTDGWEAIDRTAPLLDAARGASVPVIYITKLSGLNIPWDGTASRKRVDDRLTEEQRAIAYEIVDEIAPQDGEVVLKKSAASAFRGTALSYYLNYHRIDTVIVCGETTSGCVRATVVDAATERYRVGVVQDCCFDRLQASHWISLFDMNQKYADVIAAQAAESYFSTL